MNFIKAFDLLAQRTTLVIVSLGFIASLPVVLGCSSDKNCTPGFDKGEQFRITLTGRATDTACGILDLAPGTSFVLTAGDLSPLVTPDGCQERAAAPETPSFAGNVIGACMSGPDQLGLVCDAEYPQDCHASVGMAVGPAITRDTTVIDDGEFGMYWSWKGDASACGLPGGYCRDEYTVRMERFSAVDAGLPEAGDQ